jgi:hypothetical protein
MFYGVKRNRTSSGQYSKIPPETGIGVHILHKARGERHFQLDRRDFIFPTDRFSRLITNLVADPAVVGEMRTQNVI